MTDLTCQIIISMPKLKVIYLLNIFYNSCAGQEIDHKIEEMKGISENDRSYQMNTTSRDEFLFAMNLHYHIILTSIIKKKNNVICIYIIVVIIINVSFNMPSKKKKMYHLIFSGEASSFHVVKDALLTNSYTSKLWLVASKDVFLITHIVEQLPTSIFSTSFINKFFKVGVDDFRRHLAYSLKIIPILSYDFSNHPIG